MFLQDFPRLAIASHSALSPLDHLSLKPWEAGGLGWNDQGLSSSCTSGPSYISNLVPEGSFLITPVELGTGKMRMQEGFLLGEVKDCRNSKFGAD